jgi:hypothetical protein
LSFYPDKKADLDAILATALTGIPEGDAKANGIRLGYEAAAGIMALRASDGSDVAESYRPHTNPGLYVPTVVPVNSTAGAVTPWVMTSGSQFRPAAPPALNSETWTRDSSPTAPGVTRRWTRFQDYSDEVSNARIYAGFHYRFSTDVGKDMGKKIGELTLATQLRGATAAAEPRR